MNDQNLGRTPEDNSIPNVPEPPVPRAAHHQAFPGLPMSAGGFAVPIPVLIPMITLVAAVTLAVFAFFVGITRDPANTVSPSTVETRQYVLVGMAGLSFLLAVLALAIRRVRRWLGLAALGCCVAGLVLAVTWLGI